MRKNLKEGKWTVVRLGQLIPSFSLDIFELTLEDGMLCSDYSYQYYQDLCSIYMFHDPKLECVWLTDHHHILFRSHQIVCWVPVILMCLDRRLIESEFSHRLDQLEVDLPSKSWRWRAVHLTCAMKLAGELRNPKHKLVTGCHSGRPYDAPIACCDMLPPFLDPFLQNLPKLQCNLENFTVLMMLFFPPVLFFMRFWDNPHISRMLLKFGIFQGLMDLEGLQRRGEGEGCSCWTWQGFKEKMAETAWWIWSTHNFKKLAGGETPQTP